MTSPAIQLAKECAVLFISEPDGIERFYAKAQAQALRHWAKVAESYTNPLKLADDMDAASDKLGGK